MARWEITIADPNDDLTPVVFRVGGDSYSRSIVEEKTVARFTSRNAAVLTGQRTGYRYIWSLASLVVPIADARQIGKMIRLVMQGTYTHLLLTDEVEEVDPEDTSHVKNLITTIAPNPPSPATDPEGAQYGYGRFAVFPQRSDQSSRRHLGYVGDQEYKSLTLQFLELPNIVVS